MELILCYRAWLKLDKYWKKGDHCTFLKAQQSIKKLLQQIITLMPRTEGNHWEIVKIQKQLHVAENITYF